MRAHTLIGLLLVPAALALPSSADGQTFTALSTNLSLGAFGGVRIGVNHASGYQGHGDYCWEAAQAQRRDRGRGRRYGYPSSSYDHLSFYRDCVNGGLAYAYRRWQGRSFRSFRPYVALGRAVVSVIVGDRIRRPRDRYASYGRTGRRSGPGRLQRPSVPSGRRGAAARPGDRGRPSETVGRGGRTQRRDPSAQRPRASDGRGQGARRATPRTEARGSRPSARPGGRGEGRGAPAGRRPARR